MAAGVPVLCPDNSIYAEYIEHGVDGLLYDSRDQALRLSGGAADAPERAAAALVRRAHQGATRCSTRVARAAVRMLIAGAADAGGDAAPCARRERRRRR